jgi:hypothetical protein
LRGAVHRFAHSWWSIKTRNRNSLNSMDGQE